MQIITAPQKCPHYHNNSLFLAGGITNCPDWQADVLNILNVNEFTGQVCNPRRKNFPMSDPNSAKEQIEWEFDMLNTANAIMFWFPKETVCPITLYELGFWLSHYAHADMRFAKIITIGCHPEYSRLQDVRIQSNLVGNFKIYHDIHELTLATMKKISSRN